MISEKPRQQGWPQARVFLGFPTWLDTGAVRIERMVRWPRGMRCIHWLVRFKPAVEAYIRVDEGYWHNENAPYGRAPERIRRELSEHLGRFQTIAARDAYLSDLARREECPRGN